MSTIKKIILEDLAPPLLVAWLCWVSNAIMNLETNIARIDQKLASFTKQTENNNYAKVCIRTPIKQISTR